jgi:hypothetical protein
LSRKVARGLPRVAVVDALVAAPLVSTLVRHHQALRPRPRLEGYSRALNFLSSAANQSPAAFLMPV